MGASTGINVAGAIRMARDLGPGHTIVTILCDYGTRYQSKLFNPAFLREKGLPVPDWLERRGARHARCLRADAPARRAPPARGGACPAGARRSRRWRRRRPRSTPSAPSAGTRSRPRAEALVDDPETPTEALEALREELVAQRSEALAAEQERQPPVDELNKRLQALGPAPAEGAEEAPEIADAPRAT